MYSKLVSHTTFPTVASVTLRLLFFVSHGSAFCKVSARISIFRRLFLAPFSFAFLFRRSRFAFFRRRVSVIFVFIEYIDGNVVVIVEVDRVVCIRARSFLAARFNYLFLVARRAFATAHDVFGKVQRNAPDRARLFRRFARLAPGWIHLDDAAK